MAYDCESNPPADFDGEDVQIVKYFSNPDVRINGVRTGTETANNARTVRENMVRRRWS